MTDTAVRVETSPKRIRALLGGRPIVDTRRALLVWEHPYYPTYYLPMADFEDDIVRRTDETHDGPAGGSAVADLVVDDRRADGAARVVTTPADPRLADTVRLSWHKLDAWFEEDEQVYVHPRDPYKRVDILPSSAEIRVEIDGTVVAQSDRARLLFETSLPTRYYLPATDVRLDLLTSSDLVTSCPYKGDARYASVNLPDGSGGSVKHENIVWWYPFPVAESTRIAGMYCFYNEKVDIYLDGELLPRPVTPFS